MHISFYPPLGTHTLVPVSSRTADLRGDQGGVRAALTAYLSPQDYDEVVRTGLRIEAWTNAPSGTRPAGEWGPVAFEEVEEAANAPNGDEPEPCVLLNSNDQTNPLSPVESTAARTRVFRAALTLLRNPGVVFAFTYRLVYPSGICWLGSDRDNGVLELDARSAFIEEVGSWETREGRRMSVTGSELNRSGDSEDYSVVGKLDLTEWSWAGWATDGSRVWSFNDNCLEPIDEARLVFLIPAPLNNSVLLPHSYVFHALSEETRFSINSQGHVVLRSCRQGAGAISYRIHSCSSEGDLELLRSEILSTCSAPHIFPIGNLDAILFTPKHDSDMSVTIYAQSLTRRLSRVRSISMPITALEIFAKHSATLCLSIPESRNTIFVNPSEQSETLMFRFGFSGAQIIVASAYDLMEIFSPHSRWQFSLPEYAVAPEKIAPSTTVGNPLPTPPASPRTKPQRTVSFVLPSEHEEDSGLRQRKRVESSESSTPTPERSTLARRLLRSDSAFERYQAASGTEKIEVMAINVLKLLTRFMGIAALRFILFVFRLIGGERQSAETGRSEDNAASSSSLQGYSRPGAEPVEDVAYGSSVGSAAPSGVGKDTVEAPHADSRNALSTGARERDSSLDGKQECSKPQIPMTSSALKWILPTGGDTPIRLLVRSDAPPDDIFKHLTIELNGESIEKTSSVHSLEDKTNAIEFTHPGGPSAVLLVKLRD